MLTLLATVYALFYLLSTEMPSFKIIRSTISRDVRAAFLYFRLLSYLKKQHLFDYSVVDLFDQTVEKYRDKVCFIFQDEEWTFQRVQDFSNKIANSFQSQGYKKGDEVALIMENCPEFICIWLGLSRLGVITALINTNLREDALGHSINILDVKAIIFGVNFSQVVQDAIPFFKNKEIMEYYYYAEKDKMSLSTTFPAKSLNSMIEDASPSRVVLNYKKPGYTDKLFYIYTSGTTGLPKAAIIRNSRYLWISSAAKYMMQIRDDETFYNPLPLYHSAGGIIFLGIVLASGGKMVIRKKFSASNFWKECVKYDVTASQYIGEICRFLLNQPKIPEETQHRVRVMFGNGLRPHIWREFIERFNIKQIAEIYGATEGNANLANLFNKEGAVGFVPRMCDRLYPVYLMKINEETGELVRDENGLCIRCKPGEPGELVGKIVRGSPLNSFDGYANKIDTQKKIIRNCFTPGDTVFLSGDILVMDEEGYVYFVDRTGDTFRWRGENVSTGEVENIVSRALNHVAVVVYGVEIPNEEGRGGMAAIQTDEKNVDFSELYQTLTKKLPPYAVPLFLRITNSLESTGTYKLKKVTLQKEGFDPEKIPGPMFIIDKKQKTYVPFTKEIHAQILSGKARL